MHVTMDIRDPNEKLQINVIYTNFLKMFYQFGLFILFRKFQNQISFPI